MVLKGSIAKSVLEFLLSNYKGENKNVLFPFAGFYKEGDYFICFDNTTHSCYVEQTKIKSKAIKWCLNKIEAEDL